MTNTKTTTPTLSPEHRPQYAAAWRELHGGSWDPVTQSSGPAPEPGPDDYPRVIGTSDDGTGRPLLEGERMPPLPPVTITGQEVWAGLPEDVAAEWARLAGAVPAHRRLHYRRTYTGRVADALAKVATMAARIEELRSLIATTVEEIEDRRARVAQARTLLDAWDDEDDPSTAPSHLPLQRARQRFQQARERHAAYSEELSTLTVGGWQSLDAAREDAEHLMHSGWDPRHWEGMARGAETEARQQQDWASRVWRDVVAVVKERQERERAAARVSSQGNDRQRIAEVIKTATAR